MAQSYNLLSENIKTYLLKPAYITFKPSKAKIHETIKCKIENNFTNIKNIKGRNFLVIIRTKDASKYSIIQEVKITGKDHFEFKVPRIYRSGKYQINLIPGDYEVNFRTIPETKPICNISTRDTDPLKLVL